VVYGQKQALQAWSFSTWSTFGHRLLRFYYFQI
jgi:hypothetical protein